jgi:hypothetical protein
MKLEWSEGTGELPVSLANTGDFMALIQQVTPGPETAYRNRRYEVQWREETLLIGFCNGTADAEAIVEFVIEHKIG